MSEDAGWKETRALYRRNSGSMFLGLRGNNDQAEGVICGAPYGREVHWDPEAQDYVSCTGTVCGHCKAALKKTTRVLVNIWPPGEQRMMVIEVTGKTFEDICAVRDSVGDLEKKVLVITRHGAPGNTKTRYTVWPKRDVTAEEQAILAKTPLHDLKHAAAEARDDEDEDGPAPTAAPPSAAPDPGATIAAPVVAEFRKRLRDLPRDKAYEPMLKFLGAKRLDEIRASDEHRARSLIERAERGEALPPPSPANDELDEFA